MTDRQHPPGTWAILVTFGLALALVGVLATGARDAADFISPGTNGLAQEIIAEDFGEEAIPYGTGYDGQQTYAVARDFPDLDKASESLDSARYRILRILPPAIASLAPRGAPTVVALALINIIGIGMAIWGAERLLDGRRAGLAILAGVPLILGLVLTTTEPIAWGLTILAISFAVDRRHAIAIALFVLAGLCRETSVLVPTAAGLIFALPKTHTVADRLRLLVAYAIPGAVALGWFVLAGVLASGEIRDRFQLGAFVHIEGMEGVLVVAIFLVGLIGAYGWRDTPLVALVCGGFSVWMLAYTRDAFDGYAIARINGLSIGLGLVGCFRMAIQRSGATPIRSAPPGASSG